MTEHEEKYCKRFHELFAISEEPGGANKLIDIIIDLDAQVESLSGNMAEQENRIKALEERNGDLIKMLHEAQNDYYDLRQKKIVCPGEAARYYLEETRRLKKMLKLMDQREEHASV